jgi:hypothetical protein
MVVVISYKTKATACRALTFIVHIFVNDTIAIAVWTSFDTITIAVWISLHLCVPSGGCSDSRAMSLSASNGHWRASSHWHRQGGIAGLCGISPPFQLKLF